MRRSRAMRPKSDEVVRRAPGRDPRAEPESLPPKEEAPIAAEPAVPEPEIVRTELPASSPPPKIARSTPPTPIEDGSRITNVDPRFEEVERHIAAGAWTEVATRLGPPEQAGRLPPTLGLIYALARHEAPGVAGAAGTSELAIRCVAAIFGVPESSSTAIVIAKRLLRRNPAAWRTRPAPPAKVSFFIVVVTIALGAAIGWLASKGSLRFR